MTIREVLMGVTNTDVFQTRHNEIAAFAKAIGHPARVAILEHLAQTNQCITGDLVDVLPLAQATVSQHLTELKKAGLIRGNVSGTSVCYCLDKQQWARCIRTLDRLFNKIKSKTKCC